MLTDFIKKFKIEKNQILGIRIVYLLLIVISLWQTFFLEPSPNNNFMIFKQSFFHLIEQKQLYTYYPYEYQDLYFYHPTFALLFAPFAVLSWQFGLVLWVCAIVFVFYTAIQKLPLATWTIQLITLLIIFELAKNIRHVQPNILNTGLMLWVFYCFEKNRMALGALLCVLLFCIKGFGAVVAISLFFYPQSWRTILYGILFSITLFLLPIIVSSPERLLAHYKDWLLVLQSPSIVEPDALISFFVKITGSQTIENKVTLLGLIFLFVIWLVNFLNRKTNTLLQRLDFFAFLLIWVVAFNRAAESPTYLHAVLGVLILWANTKNVIHKWLLMSSFALWMLAPSDLAPRALRELIKAWSLKSVVLLIPLAVIFYTAIQTFFISNRKNS